MGRIFNNLLAGVYFTTAVGIGTLAVDNLREANEKDPTWHYHLHFSEGRTNMCSEGREFADYSIKGILEGGFALWLTGRGFKRMRRDD